MASRQLVSYDDITLPYEQKQDTSVSAFSAQPPAVKKRKKNNQKSKFGAQKAQNSVGKTDSESYVYLEDADNGEDQEEESRELTHEEIWDDSALVDAWEAAQQEYEMYHGKGKDWKNEPFKRSALWYNIPADTSSKVDDTPAKANASTTPVIAAMVVDDDTEADSQPINFESFVPSHDPSLPAPPMMTQDYMPDTPAGPMVSQDEAFSKAMNAMYWSGYWTAMYHSQRRLSKEHRNDNSNTDLDADDREAQKEELDQRETNSELISTQR